MTNRQIEISGVSILQRKIAKFNHLEPFINNNDKTPGWDGEIYLYDKNEKNKEHSNQFFRGKIQVQVKSTEEIKNNSYTLKRTYLDMFEKDGNGTLLFVVDVTNEKVYYRNLLQQEIKRILEEFNDYQETKSIKIKLAADENINIIDKVCENFWKNSNYQKNIVKINSKNYKNIFKNNKEAKLINFDGEINLYIRDSITKKYNYILDGIQKVEINIPLEMEVSSNNNKYLLKVERVFCNNELKKVIIGDTIIVEKGINKINFELNNNNIKDTIELLKFILDCIKEKKIVIDNIFSIDFKEIPKEQIIFFEERLEYLEKIENKLDKYGVELKNKIKDFSEDDWKMFNILINLNNYKKLEEKNIVYLEIKNKFIFVLLIKDKEGLIKDYNYFEETKEDFEMVVNNVHYKYSPYITLKKEELINTLNMNIQTIEKSIKKIYMPELSEYYNSFLLEVLKAYDETKETKWLKLAEMIITLIISKEKENNNIYIINKYQILRRKRKLTDKEKNELKNIYDSDDNIMVKVSCSILIGNSYDFKFNFEKLNEKEKEEFQKYPIYNLLNLE